MFISLENFLEAGEGLMTIQHASIHIFQLHSVIILPITILQAVWSEDLPASHVEKFGFYVVKPDDLKQWYEGLDK